MPTATFLASAFCIKLHQTEVGFELPDN